MLYCSHTKYVLVNTIPSVDHKLAWVLYISQIIFTIGIFPIVFLKKSSSMTSPGTFLSVGSKRSSFPNLKGCPGCVELIYLLSVNWVSSCIAEILTGSLKTLSEVGGEEEDGLSKLVLNKIVARKQEYSCGSTWNCLMFTRISWNSCTFCMKLVLSTCPKFGTRWGKYVMGRNWAAPNTNSSLQLSSRSKNWSLTGREVNAYRDLAHWTFMKSSLAAASQTTAGLGMCGDGTGWSGIGNCKRKKT